jgi:hypothetical protein
MATNFTFTRNPSVKIKVSTELSGLVTADNTLILIGRMGSTAGSATAGTLNTIDSFGDPVAAKTECDTKFGLNSTASCEATEMVLAAINAVLYSSLDPKSYPVIKVLLLANNATSSTLAATLANFLSVPMPFIVSCYPASDTAAMTALKAHVSAITASDRGLNGQFGSFAVMATDEATSPATTEGLAAATEGMLIAWLRDTATTKANKIHAVASAYAAVCAANGVPFNPLDGVKIGGLVAPVSAVDWHTPGDTGTVALGLAAGLTPLAVDTTGAVTISRSITTRRASQAIEETAYYDLQDWQVLYYIRKNVYAISIQPRYKIAKATDRKIQSLKSEIIDLLKTLEKAPFEMVQHVEDFLPLMTAGRSTANRHAGVYYIPMNVVPGFHNKGIDLVGTTLFDITA